MNDLGIRVAVSSLIRTAQLISGEWQDEAAGRFRRDVVDALRSHALRLAAVEDDVRDEIRDACKDL